MTQEELDAMMNGDIDGFEDDVQEEVIEEVVSEDLSSSTKGVPLGYNESTAHNWPLPATDENKMVHQLDDVTKESEEKATQMFDILEGVSIELMDQEEKVQIVADTLTSNVELFTTLSAKFPDVAAFKTQLEKNQEALTEVDGTIETLQNSGDSIMSMIDLMQYQDIHRQKIERVINVMRALSTYMNTLFEGKVDDDKRVSSAQHIAGDTHNDLASTDDIEALLAQFGS
ncbi:MAG: hypothetical protein ACJAWW_000146 [Sulfurimonas sp.]|jgi:hypothetical protein